MDGINRIAEKIISGSEEKARKILSDAQDQTVQLDVKIQNEIAGQIQALEVKAKNEAADLAKIIEANAELEMRNHILTLKQSLIENVFQTVFEKLTHMPPDSYETFMVNSLLKLTVTGTEEIVFGKKEADGTGSKIVENANRALTARGLTGNLQLSKELCDGSGGFILKANGYEVNHSFESLVMRIREEIEPRVVDVLFD